MMGGKLLNHGEINLIIYKTEFWYGVAFAPILALSLFLIVLYFWKCYQSIKPWFKNLPITAWFGMSLIFIGQKCIGKKHWEVMRYDSKMWLHLKCAGMQLPEDIIDG